MDRCADRRSLRLPSSDNRESPQTSCHRVEKATHTGQTTIRVQALSFAERIEEIARMSGGARITAVARQHAEEMLTRHA